MATDAEWSVLRLLPSEINNYLLRFVRTEHKIILSWSGVLNILQAGPPKAGSLQLPPHPKMPSGAHEERRIAIDNIPDHIGYIGVLRLSYHQAAWPCCCPPRTDAEAQFDFFAHLSLSWGRQRNIYWLLLTSFPLHILQLKVWISSRTFYFFAASELWWSLVWNWQKGSTICDKGEEEKCAVSVVTSSSLA